METLSVFVHGHTYQGHPAGCAAALEVQRIIREDNLLENVRAMGKLLSTRLQERLGAHPNVGNIRGKGLFWGIEFVADKETMAPFPAGDRVALTICERGLTREYGISVYPGNGSADGINGDHIIISPAYNVRSEEIEWMVDGIGRLVEDFFAAYRAGGDGC
jgi:adenosylmethionine-8-amino-7-oxononanoate aminotransferase